MLPSLTWGSLHRYNFLNSAKVRSENWFRPTGRRRKRGTFLLATDHTPKPEWAGGVGGVGWGCRGKRLLLWKLWLPALCRSICLLLSRKMRSLRGYSPGPYRRLFCGERDGGQSPSAAPHRDPHRSRGFPGPLPSSRSFTCSIHALNCSSSAGKSGEASVASSARLGSPRRALGERPGRRAEPSRGTPPTLPVALYLRRRVPKRWRAPGARRQPTGRPRASPWRAEPPPEGRGRGRGFEGAWLGGVVLRGAGQWAGHPSPPGAGNRSAGAADKNMPSPGSP